MSTYPLRLTADQFADVREHYAEDAPTLEELMAEAHAAQARTNAAEQAWQADWLNDELYAQYQALDAVSYALWGQVERRAYGPLDGWCVNGGPCDGHCGDAGCPVYEQAMRRAYAEAGDLGDDDRDAIPF